MNQKYSALSYLLQTNVYNKYDNDFAKDYINSYSCYLATMSRLPIFFTLTHVCIYLKTLQFVFNITL